MSSKSTSSDKKRNVLRIDNVYYDTERIAAIHPGGEVMVHLSNQTDATALFVSSHRRRFPHDKYTAYAVAASDVADDVKLPEYQQDFSLYLSICDKVRPILAPTNGFAPWWYFIKVAVLIGVVVGLDLLSFVWARPLWTTVLQSFCMAWIGLNIQHDANHGAVSRNARVNRILGLCQDLCGGASIAWMYNHNVVHHVHCNDVDRDADLEIPLLRLMKKVPWSMGYQFQQFYFLLLEAVFGPVHVITNQIWMWRGPDDKMKIVGNEWNVSRAISLVIPLRVVGFLLSQPTVGLAVAHSLLQYCVGGLYLAFFFLISHNFVGARKEGVDSRKGCFVKNQAETSSNVAGQILQFFNGGLNFQIEHHLFPRVHHSYYHQLSPVVRKVCEERGITYTHFPTIGDNFSSTFHHLESLGHNPEEDKKRK